MKMPTMTRTSRDPATVEVTPLRLDPDYAAQTAIRDLLQRKIDLVRAQLDLAAMERAGAATSKDAQVHRNFARIKAAALDATRPTTPAASTGDHPPAVVVALAALQDGPPKRRNTLAEREQADDLVALLQAGVLVQQRVIDDIASTLSWEHAKRVQAQHRARMADIMEGARALSAAVEAEAAMVNATVAAGMTWRFDINPRPIPPAAADLGRGADWGSQISTFRRDLEEMTK